MARAGHNYVLTTGTGSGKSLAYIVPVVDHVLRRGPGRGIQAIVVYPMNALANSQYGELEKFLNYGYPNRQGPVTFARYTGHTGTVTPLRSQDERPASMKPPELEPEEPSTVDWAAEERFTYAPQLPDSSHPQPEEGANGVAEPSPREGASLPTDTPKCHAPSESEDAAHNGHATPAAPNLYDAALALNACIPDGEKVERDLLLTDAARELGYPNLTRKVRRVLNQALNVEHSAGRLKTDWQRVWRPRKK
jgi:hypothetical protein